MDTKIKDNIWNKAVCNGGTADQKIIAIILYLLFDMLK